MGLTRTSPRRDNEAERRPAASRHLVRSAVVIGAVTILACAGLGYWAYGESRAGMKRAIADRNGSLARRLASHALTHSAPGDHVGHDQLLDEIARLWAETEPLYSGSYLCVIEKPGVITLHTANPDAVGSNVGGVDVPLPGNRRHTVADLLASGRDWAGTNTNFAGTPQIVGYSYVPELDGTVVVHTPVKLVEEDLRAAAIPWAVGLALIGGLLVPLTIGLLHASYASAQRSARRAEGRRTLLEEQLRHSQKMEAVGRLAGGVAHDFNNMLTSLFGNVEMARISIEDGKPAETAAHLDEIERSGQRAARLTRQLLTFSRKQSVRLEPLDLNRCVSDVREMLERLIGDDVTVELDLDPRLPLIRGDSGMLEQVVINLAVNGRDAMPAGGTLQIRTSPEASGTPHARLEIRDSGVGMREETVEHIFEPFFTTKDKDKGTGLGLSTVYGIVQKLGGRIDVASELGRGSIFTVLLPTIGVDGEPPNPNEES